MQLQSSQLTGLLGAILLCAGFASTITLGDEPKETPDPVEQAPAEKAKSDETQPDEYKGMVEVRISMPDGRVIIRHVPAKRYSARREYRSSISASRILPDGSRISYAHGSVSGGSNSSSLSAGGSHVSGSGGGGGGGSARRGGGGGGGGSARSGGGGGGGGSSASSSGARTSGVSTITGGGASEVVLGGAESGSSDDLMGETIQSGSGDDSSSYTGSGVGVFTKVVNTSSSGSSDSGESNTDDDPGVSIPAASTRSASGAVSTIGAPSYTQDGAEGGQRVEFHDAGIGAAVIGNTVYLVGVEIVQADQDFEMVRGTRIGADSVIMTTARSSGSSDQLGSWNTGSSTIMIDFESNTTVDLVMFSQSADASNPDREERTWRVRIR